MIHCGSLYHIVAVRAKTPWLLFCVISTLLPCCKEFATKINRRYININAKIKEAKPIIYFRPLLCIISGFATRILFLFISTL